MAGVGMGGDALAGARGDLQERPGSSGEEEHRRVGAGEAPPYPRGRLAQVGFQGRQGDLEALRSAVVLATRPQEMGSDRTGGARGSEGTPVKGIAREGFEVTSPDVASKPSRIVFKVRRRR